jgi:hypothetical protein
MKLLDVNYKPFENTAGDINQMFWLYDTTQRDFMLKDCNVWFNVKTDAYRMMIGNHEIIIPETYNIIIGDIEVGIDIITPAEIVGREFDAMIINNEFLPDSWSLEPIVITGFESNVDIIFPYTKFPVPISLSDKKVIMIASDDCYSKIKELDFADFV